MDKELDPIEYITHMLENKSTSKQATYKNLQTAFALLFKESKRVIDELKKKAKPGDKDVTLECKQTSDHEFHVKLAGDLLIFVLHTNVVTFDEGHSIIQDPYIRENELNRYFGQINVYNFMSDSLKFNRVNDPGYLVGRLMINHENRFFIEGEGRLAALFSSISSVPVHEADLAMLVKHALLVAIDNDLMAPPYTTVKFITLYQKQEHTPEMGGGQKIGFKMSYENKVDG
jgi:hypothetical protein